MSLELQEKIKEELELDHFLFVSNGTIALQIAIKALELKGKIITTPFSYCATTTSIIWENCTPVFVDIEPFSLNIDAALIEDSIDEDTVAIMATHVYGNPCEVYKIEEIAKKYQLPVIYDAAHAFGVKLDGKSLLHFGDIATVSFHATKVFHTAEGGGIVCHQDGLQLKMSRLRSFGHEEDNYYLAGINGKNSEFHAAMGLANLPYLDQNIAKRKSKCELYSSLLNLQKLVLPKSRFETLEYNYAYYPIILDSEETLLKVSSKLKEVDIFPRRYFYPSLNQLPYLQNSQACPVSEDLSLRVLSLPLHPDIPDELIGQIAAIINSCL